MTDPIPSPPRAATISEVVSALQEGKEKHGDMPVYFMCGDGVHPVFLPDGVTLGQLHDDIKDERTTIVIIS